MKTKIKNEFQNPNLIFGNENQNWKTKIENEKDDKEGFQNEKQNFKGNQLYHGNYLFIL